jgi:GNAT superfamily N-acetyltransferase
VKLFPEKSLDCFVAYYVEVKRDFYENMLIAYAPLASNEMILDKAQILELKCFVEDVIKIHRKLYIDPEANSTGLSVHFIEQLLDACKKVVHPTLSQDENPITDEISEISSALIQKIVSSCKYVLEMYEWFGYIDPEPETTRSICFLHHICQEVVNST